MSLNAGFDAQQEIRRLELENKKLSRQLTVANNTIDRYKVTSAAQENLRAMLIAEKSKHEKHMALLLQSAPDIILLLDTQGRLVFCTEAFLRAAGIINFGLVGGQVLDAVIRPYCTQEALDKSIEAFREMLRTGQSALLEEKIDFSRTGAPRSYSISGSPVLDAQGKPDSVLVIFHDITDVMSEKERAEAANSAKSDFLVTISHEIRTPLNAIIGLTGMLMKTALVDKQREYMRNIEQSSGLLLNLINDILDFSKIDAGKLELTNEFFSLTALLDKLRSLYHVLMRQKGLRFHCEIAPDMPRVMLGDEKRLGQVLGNLLNNALKYTQEGYVTLRVCLSDGFLCIDVEDSGIGIRPQDLPRLFTAFEQLDREKNRNIAGTGLGLPITRRLCELMGGHVTARSVYGKGTTFTVMIPGTAGQDSDLPLEPERSFAFVAPQARVLVVDDIDINLVVASAMLENFGITAQTAGGGQEAVRMAGASDFDIVFMDHMMPDVDGIEATKRIRALGSPRALVPIVALTANAIIGAQEMFLSNGFSDFISKPIDPQALSACLIKWLPGDAVHELHDGTLSDDVRR